MSYKIKKAFVFLGDAFRTGQIGNFSDDMAGKILKAIPGSVEKVIASKKDDVKVEAEKQVEKQKRKSHKKNTK